MPHNYQLIRENLQLTQEFCEQQLANSTFDNAAIFRSINPEYDGIPLFGYTKGFYGDFNITEWSKDPYDKENKTLILELFDYQLNVKKSSHLEDSLGKINKEGKIFAFLINYTLIDGAATDASGGLLDDYNCPPIDTWFHIFYSTNGPVLLAWIPECYINLIDEGIDVNPEECIQWLDVWFPEINANIME